jgi:XRE family transcriptional regulator, regulator of sulfur utilization
VRIVVRKASVSKASEEANEGDAHRDVEADSRYVGQAIETQRVSAGLTQGDLAQLSGVSQPHISSIEKGTWSPKLNTVMLIAEALGLDVNVLLPPSRRDRSYEP